MIINDIFTLIEYWIDNWCLLIFLQPIYIKNNNKYEILKYELLIRLINPLKKFDNIDYKWDLLDSDLFFPDQIFEYIPEEYYSKLFKLIMNASKIIIIYNNFNISINITEYDLNYFNFPHFFNSIDSKHKMFFEFEILESVKNLSSKSINNLVYLNKEWCKLSVDDYWSTYSNLNRLIELSHNWIYINYIKIDKDFLLNKKYQELEKLVFEIKNFNKDVHIIVEWIESKDDIEFLDSLWISIFQWFYLSRPLPFYCIL